MGILFLTSSESNLGAFEASNMFPEDRGFLLLFLLTKDVFQAGCNCGPKPTQDTTTPKQFHMLISHATLAIMVHKRVCTSYHVLLSNISQYRDGPWSPLFFAEHSSVLHSGDHLNHHSQLFPRMKGPDSSFRKAILTADRLT